VLDFGIGRWTCRKECDMRGLVGLALASMTVIVILGPAAAQSSQRRAWCLNQGGTFSVDQRINGCPSIIQSRRESPRNLAVAYYSRGLAYYDKGDDDRAIAEFNEAIPLDPKSAQAYSSRGLAYDHKGDLGHADPDYNEAIRLDPKYGQAYFNRGNAHYQKGDDDRAIADYSEAIRLDPKYAYAYKNRGTAYDHKGEADRAITDYNEAIQLDPKFAQAYSNRGLAYYQKGDLDHAIADYGEAIRLDPKYAYAYNNRGNAYYPLRRAGLAGCCACPQCEARAPQRRETGRSAGAAGHESRVDPQPQDREGTWSYRALAVARTRRRGDRIKGCLLHRMSLVVRVRYCGASECQLSGELRKSLWRDRKVEDDAVDGAHSTASMCQRVVALKRTQVGFTKSAVR
jgi:tetratricopeptide (TPR) repeat protein